MVDRPVRLPKGTKMRALPRRNILRAALGLTVLGLPGPLGRNGGQVHERAVTLLGATPGASTIGALYLRQRPEEADAVRLVRLLGSSDRRGAAATDRALAGQISRDWSAGQIVVVAGWCFARTEARLCALAHLGRVQA